MKLAFLTIIAFTVISCSNYKFKFVPTDKDLEHKLDNAFLKYLEKNELYLCFTSSYQDYYVKVIQDGVIIYDSLITTNKKGLAKTFKVSETSDIIFYFAGFKRPLEIEKVDLNNYKFIFIHKKDEKVLVEFNNGKTGFKAELRDFAK